MTSVRAIALQESPIEPSLEKIEHVVWANNKGDWQAEDLKVLLVEEKNKPNEFEWLYYGLRIQASQGLKEE